MSIKPDDAIPKVLAYITRILHGDRQLLVFTHQDFPEAGLQVPAGTVHVGEPLVEALLREVREEAGLSRFVKTEKLTEYLWWCAPRHEWHHRHVFHLSVTDAPDYWNHAVTSFDSDAGMVFQYHWVSLDAVPTLAAQQDEWLRLLRP